jgi:hypothetical protein
MNTAKFNNSLRLYGLFLCVILTVACKEKDKQATQEVADQPSEPAIIQKPSAFAYSDILSEDFYKLTREEGQKWQSYFDLLDYHKVLELSELKDDQDFALHNDYLEKYISASEHYLDFLSNLRSRANEKFTAYAIPEPQVTPVLDLLLSTYEKQKGTLVDLLKAHVEYGKEMQSLLQFLQANQQQWQLVDEKLDIKDKNLASQYNGYIDKIIAIEDRIEQYSKELDFHLKE